MLVVVDIGFAGGGAGLAGGCNGGAVGGGAVVTEGAGGGRLAGGATGGVLWLLGGN